MCSSCPTSADQAPGPVGRADAHARATTVRRLEGSDAYDQITTLCAGPICPHKLTSAAMSCNNSAAAPGEQRQPREHRRLATTGATWSLSTRRRVRTALSAPNGARSLKRACLGLPRGQAICFWRTGASMTSRRRSHPLASAESRRRTLSLAA